MGKEQVRERHLLALRRGRQDVSFLAPDHADKIATAVKVRLGDDAFHPKTAMDPLRAPPGQRETHKSIEYSKTTSGMKWKEKDLSTPPHGSRPAHGRKNIQQSTSTLGGARRGGTSNTAENSKQQASLTRSPFAPSRQQRKSRHASYRKSHSLAQ